jgi:hypothetical protein
MNRALPMSALTLFESRGKGAIVEMPFRFSAAEWSAATEAFLAACGRRKADIGASVWTLYPDQQHFSIPYSWGLHSSEGSWFVVHRFPERSEADVRLCCAEIHARQDVVTLRVNRVYEWVKFELPATAATMPKQSSRLKDFVHAAEQML